MKIASIKVNERGYPRPTYIRQPNGSVKLDRRGFNKDHTEYKETTRIYLSYPLESIMDNIINRRSRPWKALKPLIEAELRDAGYTGRVRWSKHAGCKMCPCSPGFVLDTNLDYSAPVDVWVTVKE
jgi:hypothetical protein